ncbi:MAG: polysaccharide deacetylase family protein [Rhizobiaceae bacterium]
MSNFKTFATRKILTGMNLTGLDRIYQQLDTELGMILTFHHVRPDPIPKFSPNAHLSIHPEFLAKVIEFLRGRNIEIISLDEAQQRILNPKELRRFAVFTFDDGYRDTLEHAVPVLAKYKVPYTVYFAPGFIEGTADLWWEGIESLVRQQDGLFLQREEGTVELDCSSLSKKHKTFQYLLHYLTNDTPELDQHRRVREICWPYKIDMSAMLREQMMTWDEVRLISQDPLCTVGAHTLNHRALARLEPKQALNEMVQGASILEMELGLRPAHFAYPYGYLAAANARDFQLAREAGFQTAVTTRPGMIFPEHREHLTALPRLSVNGLFQSMRHFSPLTSGLPTRLSAKMKKLNVS